MSPLSLLSPPQTPEQIPFPELMLQDWMAPLAGCRQDRVHHAEGDVAIHTKMVLESLLEMPAYKALSPRDKWTAYVASLMHDIGKPQTTIEEPDGKITSRGHSRAGELMARRLLWEMGAPLSLREQVCGLIRYHQVPFFLVDNDDSLRTAAELSLRCRADLLSIVAEADIRGRHCQDLSRVLDSIELFREYCREEGCLTQPRAFASDHTRVTYFRSQGRHPDVPVFDDCRCEMVIMVGLPGSGKDSYIREHYPKWPVVSLDALREELGIDPTDEQGAVIQAAKERAREHLRAGQSFVWNGTNHNQRRRAPLLTLAADYKARIKMVCIEVPPTLLFAQNRNRAAEVPEAVIHRMTERWEMPSLAEAHALEWVVRGESPELGG